MRRKRWLCLPDESKGKSNYVAPDVEEELAMLSNMQKGKLSSRWVTYNPVGKGGSTEGVSDTRESTDTKQEVLAIVLTKESLDISQEAANDDVHRVNTDISLWNRHPQIGVVEINIIDYEADQKKKKQRVSSDG